MSNMSMEVEFLAGTDIEKAIIEAKAMARRLGLAYIIFKFNGVSCSIGATANIEVAVEEFHKARGK